MLPYNVHVTHVLDCSYVASLQYNFTISDHSEPIVPHGAMADCMAVLSSVGGKDVAYVYCTDSVILAAYIISLKNISWILTANIQNALSLLIAFVVNPVGSIFSKRLHQWKIAVFKKNWIELHTKEAKKYCNYSCPYMSVTQGSKLRLIRSPMRLTFSPWRLKILV